MEQSKKTSQVATPAKAHATPPDCSSVTPARTDFSRSFTPKQRSDAASIVANLLVSSVPPTETPHHSQSKEPEGEESKAHSTISSKVTKKGKKRNEPESSDAEDSEPEEEAKKDKKPLEVDESRGKKSAETRKRNKELKEAQEKKKFDDLVARLEATTKELEAIKANQPPPSSAFLRTSLGPSEDFATDVAAAKEYFNSWKSESGGPNGCMFVRGAQVPVGHYEVVTTTNGGVFLCAVGVAEGSKRVGVAALEALELRMSTGKLDYYVLMNKQDGTPKTSKLAVDSTVVLLPVGCVIRATALSNGWGMATSKEALVEVATHQGLAMREYSVINQLIEIGSLGPMKDVPGFINATKRLKVNLFSQWGSRPSRIMLQLNCVYSDSTASLSGTFDPRWVLEDKFVNNQFVARWEAESLFVGMNPATGWEKWVAAIPADALVLKHLDALLPALVARTDDEKAKSDFPKKSRPKFDEPMPGTVKSYRAMAASLRTGAVTGPPMASSNVAASVKKFKEDNIPIDDELNLDP